MRYSGRVTLTAADILRRIRKMPRCNECDVPMIKKTTWHKYCCVRCRMRAYRKRLVRRSVRIPPVPTGKAVKM